MIARVVSGKVLKGAIDELQRVLEQYVVPCNREHAGFKGALGLVDRSTGRGIYITFWESPEDVAAVECAGHFAQEFAQVASLLEGPVVRETYEVALDV